MAKKLFPKRALKPNFDRPGEIYFIRGVDLITREQSPYVKIGLVGDKKESEPSESSEDENQVGDVASDELDPDETQDESEKVDLAEVESRTYEQFKARKSLDRLKEHQTGNPQKLVLNDASVVTVAAVSATEKAMHNMFAKLRVRGEWFYIPEDSLLVELIDKCREFDKMLNMFRDVILKASSLSQFVTSESLAAKTSVAEDAAESWRELTRVIQEKQRRMATIANLIGAEMREVGEIDGVSTWTYKKPSRRFDQKGFKAKYPEIFNRAFVPAISRGALTVKDKPKAPMTDPEMLMKFDADLSKMEQTGKRTQDLQELHLEYLELLQDSEQLEWERLFAASTLKVECDLSAGIEGICGWKGKQTSRFSQPLLKTILKEEGKLDFFEEHYPIGKESFSFRVLPMRPYPIA